MYENENNLLNEAFARYTNLILQDGEKLTDGQIKSCSVFVECPCEANQIVDADESYSLSVDEIGNCAISAAN